MSVCVLSRFGGYNFIMTGPHMLGGHNLLADWHPIVCHLSILVCVHLTIHPFLARIRFGVAIHPDTLAYFVRAVIIHPCGHVTLKNVTEIAYEIFSLRNDRRAASCQDPSMPRICYRRICLAPSTSLKNTLSFVKFEAQM